MDVTASAKNIHLNTSEPTDQITLSEFAVESFQIYSTLAMLVVGGANNVSGTFGIYSQLCFPNNQTNTVTV